MCRIPAVEIERLCQESPRLFKQLTARWQNALADADIWLANLTVGSARKRVASLLLYLEKKDKNNCSFLMKKYLPIHSQFSNKILTTRSSRLSLNPSRSARADTASSFPGKNK